MAQSSVQTELTANDKLTPALKRAESRLRGWAAGAGSAIASVDRKFTAFAVGVGHALQRAMKYLLGFGAAIGGIGAYAVKLASDVEEADSKFNAVFKDGAENARKWAGSFAAEVGRSVHDIASYMAQLQDTFVPLGFARDNAAKLSEVITRLAVDLASFNNASESETVDLLTSALIGNHEAVRRFGVIITEATLKQKLMEMGVRGGTAAATEQQKALARLQIILDSTADAQGDAARTAGSMANQWKAMGAKLKDLGVAIGKALMPVAQALTRLMSAVSEKLTAAVEGSMPAITAALQTVVDLIDGITTGVSNIDFSTWKEQLSNLLSDIGDVFIEALKDIGLLLIDVAGRMGDAFLEKIEDRVPGVKTARAVGSGLNVRGAQIGTRLGEWWAGDTLKDKTKTGSLVGASDPKFRSWALGQRNRPLGAAASDYFSGVGGAIDKLRANVAAAAPEPGPVRYELPEREGATQAAITKMFTGGGERSLLGRLADSLKRSAAVGGMQMQMQTQMGMGALNSWLMGQAAALPAKLAAAGAKAGGGYTAQFEDITGHYKRIQAAAASKSPELDVQKRIEKQLEVQTRVEQAAAKTGELIAKGMDAASAGIAELVKRGFRAVAG